MAREVWFHLVDRETRDAFEGTAEDAVELPENELSVRALRDAVKVKYNDSHLTGIAPSDLRVFVDRMEYDDRENGKPLLKASTHLDEHGNDEDHALIVEVPQRRATKKRRYEEEHTVQTQPRRDFSEQWLEKFHASCVSITALPSIHSLAEFVASPLPVKVGLESAVFTASNVRVSTLSKICVVDAAAPCVEIWKKALYHAVEPLDADGNEKGFHGFWDCFIRQPIRTIFARKGHTGRDTSDSTSTGKQRPDMFFILNDICVFRGEEQSPGEDINGPRNELSDKLVWIYGDQVPYMFGYAASGYQCALYALHPNEDGTKVETTQIGMYMTTDVTERFEFVLAVLQLCRLFDSIVSVCPEEATREITDIARSNGVVVRLNSASVVKDFSEAYTYDGSPVVTKSLLQTYELLRNYDVPHVVYLYKVSKCGRKFTFRPRGLDVRPSTVADLFSAIECVLTALVVLHQHDLMHRDIRWSNVIKYRGSAPAWFLIDFVDAAHSPQCYPSGSHLRENEHAPEIFVEGGTHTTAVDLWSIGHLILQWDTQSEWGVSPQRASYMLCLLSRDPKKRPTAEQALDMLKVLRLNYEKENR